MTYNELRYTLTMFNKWRSCNYEKFKKISEYLGSAGKCLSLFEYHTNEALKKQKDLKWHEIYRIVSKAMTDFLETCSTFDELGADEELEYMVESVPHRFGFLKGGSHGQK